MTTNNEPSGEDVRYGTRGGRLTILAMAACDRPVAVPTTRRLAPAAMASRMALSRRSVHSRALRAACVAADRSGSDCTAEVAVLLADCAENLSVPLSACLPLGFAGVAAPAEVLGVAGAGACGASAHGDTVNDVHGTCQHRAQIIGNKVDGRVETWFTLGVRENHTESCEGSGKEATMATTKIECPCGCGEVVSLRDRGFKATTVEVGPCSTMPERVYFRSQALGFVPADGPVAHRDGLVVFG